MTENILAEIRSASPNLKNAIMRPPVLYKARRLVAVNLITDAAFTEADKASALKIIRNYVPEYFDCKLEISKLSPDTEMVKRKIAEAVEACSKAIFSTLSDDDISVRKTENGFSYTIQTAPSLAGGDVCNKVTDYLKKCYCGEFSGECVTVLHKLENLEIEDKPDEVEFEVPIRKFDIEDFEIFEGDNIRKTAVYISDLNFAAEEVVICGTIDDIRERSYIGKNGQEKKYLSLVVNDTTASVYVTYFIRQKNAEKIKRLKIGDSIVCTGANEEYRGNLRYTAKTIDLGKVPKGFVPEKRASKPVPMYYHHVTPQPFNDVEQTDFLTEYSIPACLKAHTFVVFDLETTGLNSSPVSGNMDKIIEIGAFKIINGEVKESFTTFINPERRLSDEIVSLTGITEDMVAGAPAYEQVMPDFYKFCNGSILVGHNMAGFDFKFVDYYCARLGYVLERKLIDTIPLSQELLRLSNYKLNTVADHFGIKFNHHRAIDDALTTAKIFIELIKLKKTLPKLQ